MEHQIDFLCTDFFTLCRALKGKADAIFLSPPWGGIDAKPSVADGNFDVVTCNGFARMATFLREALQVAPRLAIYLPRNTDLEELDAVLVGAGIFEYEVEWANINSHRLALTVYVGT